ncbi:hypothetical protein GCM10023108_49580 [Saccharopolyspora hordei]
MLRVGAQLVRFRGQVEGLQVPVGRGVDEADRGAALADHRQQVCVARAFSRLLRGPLSVRACGSHPRLPTAPSAMAGSARDPCATRNNGGDQYRSRARWERCPPGSS